MLWPILRLSESKMLRGLFEYEKILKEFKYDIFVNCNWFVNVWQ